MKKILLTLLALCLLTATYALAATNDSRRMTAPQNDAATGRRVALVIGNSDYRYNDSMPKLSNPVNDADDMAAVLRKFGFKVSAKKNLSKEEMDEAIADFGRSIAESDAALFYYAGHGLQVRGQNYLVPVDANIDTEAQVPYKTINVNQLLDEMDSSRSRVNIVMLDACRNNPISGKFRSGATRGLASPTTMPKGTVIVYATDPGNVAADGAGRNGQFTAGLLSAFKGSDLTLGGVLYVASKQVQDSTGQQQTPYINGPATVQREFSFASPFSTSDLQPSQVQPQPVAQPQNRPTAEPVATPVVLRGFTDPTTGMEFVPVKGGCFQMGDTFGDGREDEKPVHEVCVSDFSMGKYEVTQGEWKKIMGNNPSVFSSCGENCPVDQVSWEDVQTFIAKLNRQSGQNYRLPTEAEWEYAARSGGQKEKYAGGDNVDALAWYDSNSKDKTHPVGQKQANKLGLYDMSGNVWEWVNDWYGNYRSERQQNPTGPVTGSNRVLRGGGWHNIPRFLRASDRRGSAPGYRDYGLGFRLMSPVR